MLEAILLATPPFKPLVKYIITQRGALNPIERIYAEQIEKHFSILFQGPKI